MREAKLSVTSIRDRNRQRVNGWGWLRSLNLRPEESERTFLMFASYTLTSVGILWFEVSVAALFLGEYGAESLPWIYLASAGMGTGLGFVYSWLQRVLPLHRVLVLSGVLVALPLLLFWLGMNPILLGGIVVFLMRLWLEAIHAVNELNTTIAANQLFTIWEIKRTYPFVSSGILVADVLSGLSLPFLQAWVGLPNVILLACLMLFLGSGIMYYMTRVYRQAFPDFARRRFREKAPDYTTRLQGSLRQYVGLVFAFFIMLQVLALLLDFQYLSQLEQRPNSSVSEIADFLAVFSAILGFFELITQWFVSGRVIQRLGVFGIAILPPALITGLSLITLSRSISLFAGIMILKFFDELLRYTLVAGTGPILFHPIPDSSRSRVQSIVRGIAEPLATGVIGVVMLVTIKVLRHFSIASTLPIADSQSLIFLVYTILFALFWLFAVLQLRSKYVEVLVLSADRGQLSSVSEMELPVFRRNVAEALNRANSEEEKKSCVELLTQIDPKNASEVLAPLLAKLSPARQHQSLEAMLRYPSPAYLGQVRSLISQPLVPEVYAVALRYIWLTEPEPEVDQLRDYLKPTTDPVIRGTVASLMLRRGDSHQKAEATETLRRMLTHKRERERVMGCRALGEADYLQSLRLYIEPLLQDESLRVRCAMLEAIAATHSDAYYPALLKGLHYKSTRNAAKHALERLENEAIPLLLDLAEDVYKPEIVRTNAWMTIGQIGTPEALEILVSRLMTAWGWNRYMLLRTLMKLPPETAVETVEQLVGRSGVETLIDQELQFLAHVYASLLDFDPDLVDSEEANLLRHALRDSEADAIERLFLLMRLMYDSNKIQAAAFNWRSGSRDSVGRGLEILDNTLDLHNKQALLSILDRQAETEKLQSLAEVYTYSPLPPHQRLRSLVDLRHFLSDWALACCFHLSRQMRWSLAPEQLLVCLRYPTGFVREAVLVYLQTVSPMTLSDLLPLLKDDPNPLVARQVQEMMAELSLL
jgi:HEAT repeat protein